MNLKKFKVFLFVLFVGAGLLRGAFAADTTPNCPAGAGYDSGTGQCVECEAGWFSPGGNSVCQKCGAGQYSESNGSESCSDCPMGMDSPEPGDDEVNTECTTVNCSPGYGYYGTEEGCIKCEAGWYSPGGSSQCKRCGGGRYSSARGSSGCTKCAPGTYAPVPDPDDETVVNTTCSPCPNGQFMKYQGATECEVCINDDHGNRLAAPYVSPDKTSCMACPPGNCCYRFTAHICKKGTYSIGDLACPSAYTASYSACTEGPATRSGGMCVSIPNMPAIGINKGGCNRCPNGRTTVGLGGVDESDCSVQSVSVFRGNGGSFSWPTDGSISEQDITSPYVSFETNN